MLRPPQHSARQRARVYKGYSQAMDTAASQSNTVTGLAHAHDYPFLGQGSPPLEVAAAEGCYMITPTGRRILDAAGGAIVSNIGPGRREVG